MRKGLVKALALVLSLVMMVTVVDTNYVFAASEVFSTDQIDGAEETTKHEEVFFVSVFNGNYITMSGKEGEPLLVESPFKSVDEITRAGSFTTYYGTYKNNGLTNVEKEVVNFTTPSKNFVWKADGNNDEVYQIPMNIDDNYKPTGWESVLIQHNNDGTISFASSASEKLLSVADVKETIKGVTTTHTQLVSSDIRLGQNPTANEKFIMYSASKPKKARKVTLSNVSGDQVDVSWTVPEQQMYSCFEVLYSTAENGNYVSAGYTNNTRLTVKNLNPQKTYYFKVRTHVNLKGGSYSAYSDSAVPFCTTLSLSKPAMAEFKDITLNKDGSQTITWLAAANAKSYNIYRAESRFGEYKLVTSISDDQKKDMEVEKGPDVKEILTVVQYTDNAVNTSSKYNNYYKIQSVNGNVNGEMSEPYSLEINKFGYNTYMFNDKDDKDAIASKINEIFQYQHYDQFGTNRYSFAFKKGDYTEIEDDSYNIGYYTQIIGLGKTPYDVRVKNIKTPAALANGNVTCNFWVDVENLTVAQTSENADYWNDSFKWAVSQAAPARRLNVERQTLLQWTWGDNAWASGGYIADTKFHDAVGSWCQQQYYYRNCEFTTKQTDSGAIYGVNWNQVVQGCKNVDGSSLKDNSSNYFNAAGSLLQDNGYTNWGVNGCTSVINKTDETREKPFLYFDEDTDEYAVFVPSVKKDTVGVSWSEDSMGEGVSLSLNSFYVADPEKDTADTINYALACGKNLILQPGIYKLNKAVEINRENTIVLGLGIATFTSTDDNNDTFIRVKGKKYKKDTEGYYVEDGDYDIGGVEIAGVILDAGRKTETLIEVGYEGANVDHSKNPCVLQDVICRVGGTGNLGTTGSCIVINSNNTIIDQTWIWRADHGDNTGWYENTAKNGLVVNGDYVSCYGLFVEHFQEYDILWRGDYGKTFFLQNEKCYDPQKQEEWMSHNGTKKGYAAYKVANNVKHHYVVGMGVYDVFINTNGASIFLDTAIEVPNAEDVLVENACIVEIANGSGPTVGINSIINGTAPGITTGADSKTVSGKQGGYALQRMLYYRNGKTAALPDDYDYDNETYPINPETGLIQTIDKTDVKQSENDPAAEKDIKKEALTVDGSEILGTTATTDSYFNNKIEKYTEIMEHLKLDDGPKPPVIDDRTVEEIVRDTYGVEVGMTYEVGNFKYKVTKIDCLEYGSSELIGIATGRKNKFKKASVPATTAFKTFPLRTVSVGKKAMTKVKKITTVKFGKYVKTIKASAFAGDKNLKKITFTNVTKIGTKAFYNCSSKKFKKLTIGKKVTSIGKNAFGKCANLTTLVIGAKVKTVSANAFAACKKLKAVTIGKAVKTIGKKAFNKDNKIKTITLKGKKFKKLNKAAFTKAIKNNIKAGKTKVKGTSAAKKLLKKKLKIK